MKTGCWVPAVLLTPWEAQLVEAYTAPERRGCQLVYNLDALSAAGLRALSWPRQPACSAGTVAR